VFVLDCSTAAKRASFWYGLVKTGKSQEYIHKSNVKKVFAEIICRLSAARIHSFMPAASACCRYCSRALPERPMISTGFRPVCMI
jgi:hypothetical protein